MFSDHSETKVENNKNITKCFNIWKLMSNFNPPI